MHVSISSLQISPLSRPLRHQLSHVRESYVSQTTPYRPVYGNSAAKVIVRAGNSVALDKQLTSSVRSVKNVCWISFWTQLALSLTSAGLFFFTIFAAKTRSVSSLFLLVGVGASLISTGLVRKILADARSVANAADLQSAFQKWNASGWLLRNTDINLIGMASSIIALQGQCGILVAKLLRTSTTTSLYAPTLAQGAPASIDVFAVQGCANVLMSHFVSLFFLTFALRILQRLSV